jgi:hypothetical protein
MFYVFLSALVIYALDVFLASWKAMAIGAAAIVMLYTYESARATMGRLVRERVRADRYR